MRPDKYKQAASRKYQSHQQATGKQPVIPKERSRPTLPSNTWRYQSENTSEEDNEAEIATQQLLADLQSADRDFIMDASILFNPGWLQIDQCAAIKTVDLPMDAVGLNVSSLSQTLQSIDMESRLRLFDEYIGDIESEEEEEESIGIHVGSDELKLVENTTTAVEHLTIEQNVIDPNHSSHTAEEFIVNDDVPASKNEVEKKSSDADMKTKSITEMEEWLDDLLQ